MKKTIIVALCSLASFVWAKTLYVWTASPSPLAPYGSWSTAARTIQEAVTAASSSDTVLVTNGTYQTGGLTNYPSGSVLTNRVVGKSGVTIMSVNGPKHTAIMGQGPNGTRAARCIYLPDNAVLSGFCLTNGATRVSGSTPDHCGGGAYCEPAGVLSNCVIAGNSAHQDGAGIYQGTAFDCVIVGNTSEWYGGGMWMGTLYHCTVSSNTAVWGGGAFRSTAYDCLITDNTATYAPPTAGLHNAGGGVCVGTYYRCTIRGNKATKTNGGGIAGDGSWKAMAYECLIYSNSAAGSGGGAAGAQLQNCIVYANTTGTNGGGAYASTLYNCTLVGNSALTGGGVLGGTQHNCIVYFNTASTGPNYWNTDMRYSCSSPDFGVQGCIGDDPSFVSIASHDYRLRFGSPCIDHGTNLTSTVTNDFAGCRRPIDGDFNSQGRYDIGAYEYNPSVQDSDVDGINDQWEHDRGLNPTNATDAHLRSDADPVDNFDEYVADTDPLNSNSYLRVSGLSNGLPLRVGFVSSSNRLYRLQWTTNLQASGSWTNMPGQNSVLGNGGVYWLNDTNAGAGRYYRVGVQVP